MKIRAKEIDELICIANKLISINEPYSLSSEKIYYTENIFNKLCLHLGSFRKNIPKKRNKEFEDITQSTDISVLAGITRMIIESSNIVSYFAENTQEKERLDFRINLYDYHYTKDTIKILDKLGLKKSDMCYLDKWGLDMNKKNFEDNKYFIKLSDKEKKMLLGGQKAYYWRSERSKHTVFSKNIEEGIYRLLSHYVHSFPIGTTMYTGEGNSILSLKNTVFLIVETVINYTAVAMKVYLALNFTLGKKLTIEEKDFIASVATDKFILEWIENFNKENLFL